MTSTPPPLGPLVDLHREEVSRGERFAFGQNWADFLRVLDEDRIDQARTALATMLGRGDLRGLTFLDIGSGSGLSSLVARQLGAVVHSFDFDPSSVGCTQALRDRFAPNDPCWVVERGSALDAAYLDSLGQFDVVYSWGVLHHTGEMNLALDLAAKAVKPGGLLFVAIYNDQGAWSKRWVRIKRLYCSGLAGRLLVSGVFIPWWILRQLAADLLWLRNPLRFYRQYRYQRGMSVWHDWHDWLGGFPFEVARPEEVFEFFRARGFDLIRLKTAGGSVGCNEFVFQKHHAATTTSDY